MSTDKQSKLTNAAEQVQGWFVGRLPDEWFTGPAEIVVDREEITVIGHLPAVSSAAPGEAAPGEAAPGEAAPGEAAPPTEGDATAADAPVGDATAAGGASDSDAAGEASGGDEADGASDPKLDAMVLGRSRRFREQTREARIEIAREAESLFGRKVSWGVVCEGRKVMFTTLSVPVMTRLRQAERRVLDTLVDAGVARSRSDALAWCVRLVRQHEDAWLTDLREALRRVEHVRAGGPRA
jgi:hypothetical protein